MTGDVQRANVRTMRRLLIWALGMFGFAFALVPLYGVYRNLTGLDRDAVQPLVNNTQVDFSRSVSVEMLANVQDGSIWRFTAPSETLTVHPGQLVQVDYELVNLTDRPVSGRAVPSYGPVAAGRYFKKIDCFCFRSQHLAAREKATLPVVFVIDRRLPTNMKAITLSYTLFEQTRGSGA
jgi:cytochrome c oxidase assembly protein subunit 11